MIPMHSTPNDHIEVNRFLKPLPEHAHLCATFLGQAHIAGTGPAGNARCGASSGSRRMAAA
ncbi:hypothetical protein [Paracoccus sp. SM22M-07]|uniref:hypothetical protein n=1 Tax=Paracoccus sp. SM22M-07 TaxID=1520813 RepID=UPI000A6F8B47|nr:hypothetical protein [Paracoccus sp. SM22M-07]